MNSFTTHLTQVPFGLSERTRLLIELRWGGSVNRAARELGVPQPSLNRLVLGTTTNPRAKLLEAIARGSRVSLDWLMTGAGDAPEDRDERGLRITADVARWASVMDSLELRDPVLEELLLEVPYSVLNAAIYCSGSMLGSPEIEEVAEQALSRSIQAWTALVEILVRQRGTKHVREWLRSHEVSLALGCSQGADILLDEASRLRAPVSKAIHAAIRPPKREA